MVSVTRYEARSKPSPQLMMPKLYAPGSWFLTINLSGFAVVESDCAIVLQRSLIDSLHVHLPMVTAISMSFALSIQFTTASMSPVALVLK